MKYFICIYLCLFACNLCHAKQVYNAMSGKWETVPDDNREYKNRYNPFDGSWSTQHKNSKIEYNPFESKWEWNKNTEKK